MHLAAIVGDPACARDPELSNDVNVEGSRALVADARELGVERLVFASTCSNYGRMADPTVPIDESGELRPVSLYAEQKVGIEKALLELERTATATALRPTCLRFATVYGVGNRMRFDLTVNEFTRDLWADKHLEVFGERFWRPYIHVRDAARAVRTVLDAPRRGGGRQGVQRRPLRRELPQARPRGDHHREARQGRRGVRLPRRGPARLQGLVREDPRRARLRARRTACPTASRRSWGRSRSSASAIPTTAATGTSRGRRPADPALRREAGRPRDRGRGGHAALGLAHHGPAHPGLRGGLRRAPRRAPRHRALELHRRSPSRLPGGRSGPRRRGHRARDHLRGVGQRGPLLRRHAGDRRRGGPARPGARPRGRGRPASRPAPRPCARCTTAATRPTWTRSASSARSTAWRSSRTPPTPRAPRRSAATASSGTFGLAGLLQLLLQQGALVRRGRPALDRRRRRGGARCGACARTR